ncbi:MAG: sulfotransferase domain-containing protein [Pseudomonadota bacterium]
MSLNRIIWLASYPKSGNTWIRILLGNYFSQDEGEISINELSKVTYSDIRQDLYDRVAGKPFVAETFDDAIVLRPKVQRLIVSMAKGHQFVKTHSKIERIGHIDLISPEYTAAAVYIMRNPFDVVPSYAHHCAVTIDESIDMLTHPRMVNRTDTQIMDVLGSWDQHVDSWLNAPGLPLHVLRYEDLNADTEKSMRGLLGFLQVPVKDGQLRRAIRKSSFKSLKKQEKEKGFRERPSTSDTFFRKGKTGSWREELTPAQVARVREAFLPTIEKHYPEMLEETKAFAETA